MGYFHIAQPDQYVCKPLRPCRGRDPAHPFSTCALPQRRADTGAGSIVWGPCDLLLGNELQQQAAEVNECALLAVPLDYTNIDSSPTIDLQLVKLAAAEGPSKGSVLVNPGGPGESGVEFLVESAAKYMSLVPLSPNLGRY